MATNISRMTTTASKAAVWDALTNPDKVKVWQYGSELVTSWKVGDPIRFRTEWNGQIFEQWGTVLEFTPDERLKYTLFAPRPDLEDEPENYFEMEYVVTGKGDTTELVIVQVDNRPGAEQEPEQGDENPILNMLRDLLEQ
ncbi:MAG: SRPBCC domain-containing protein [Planctomycetes bacterium]|nr:SRPBCC domain-containing protein [Planctomycetota bacterium]